MLFLLPLGLFYSQSSLIEKQLINWDSIRGTWLVDCAKALDEGHAIPERTFPEDFTPYEMMTMVPLEYRKRIQELSFQNSASNKIDQIIASLANVVECAAIQGRSYGDPHVVTFDKTGYSFQTVGEFVLVNSPGKLEIQVRQKPQSQDFSLNTAVAIQLYGDRICYYAQDIPDGSKLPIWLNGSPIQMEGRTYYLPHGGSLRLVGRNYILAGPMGERIIMDVRSGQSAFINVTVEIPRCQHHAIIGLLGNGNGNAMDEFQNNRQNNAEAWRGFVAMNAPEFASISEEMEQRYQNQLIKDFAEGYRVKPDSTLFDYRPGLNTAFYTDRSFPRVIRTFSSIPNANRTEASKRCRQMGVADAELNGCIFDAYYLNLAPNPVPNPPVATEGVIMDKVRHPIVNNNTIFSDKTPPINPAPKPVTLPTEHHDGAMKPSKEIQTPKPNISFPNARPFKTDSPASTPTHKDPPIQKPNNKVPSAPQTIPAKGGKGKK